MLRLTVLLLALVNALFLGWTLGWLDDVIGVRAIGDREPERLGRQVRPESIRILPAGPLKAPPGGALPATVPMPASGGPAGTNAAGAAGAPPAPSAEAGPAGTSQGSADAGATPACLEAGPLNAAQYATVEALLQLGLPSASWTHLRNERPALWMVYMGKFSDSDIMAKRQEELRKLKVAYEILRAPSELAPGLSLGRFEVRNNANNLHEQLTQAGVRNARVIEAVAATSMHTIRIDKPTAAIASQLLSLRADALVKGFQHCTKG